MTLEAPNQERFMGPNGQGDMVPVEPESAEPGLGEIKRNSVGNLANGEARRIAEFLVKKDGLTMGRPIGLCFKTVARLSES